MFSKNLLLPCLLDIYGAMLTDRKRELLNYYYEEDFSLSEISELTGISRQGIRDSVKKGEAELLDFEKKLGLYAKKNAAETALNEVMRQILSIREIEQSREISSRLDKLEVSLSILAELL